MVKDKVEETIVQFGIDGLFVVFIWVVIYELEGRLSLLFGNGIGTMLFWHTTVCWYVVKVVYLCIRRRKDLLLPSIISIILIQHVYTAFLVVWVMGWTDESPWEAFFSTVFSGYYTIDIPVLLGVSIAAWLFFKFLARK